MPAKNQDLPGVEGEGVSKPKIKEIEAASEAYVKARDKRMKLTEDEVATKKKLIELMKKHELTRYEYDEEVVLLTPGEDKLKVKTNTGETDEGED